MTMTPYTCDTFALHLGDYLEHDADAATRSAMDSHAAECDDCRALLADLERIRVEAAALPQLVPARDLWSGIEARIATPVVALTPGRTAAATRWMRPAAAAAALVILTAGVTYVATRHALQGDVVASVATGPTATTLRGRATPVVGLHPEAVEAALDAASERGSSAPRGATGSDGRDAGARATDVASSTPSARPADSPMLRGAGPATSQPVASLATYRPGELAALDSLYYRQILRLHEVLGQRRTILDSSTVAVLDRNIGVIDRAIAECRAALAADPASRFLNQQLNEALESKIELMRTAATMPIGS